MTMTEARLGQRDRSPSFPFIPLKVAIERLAAFEAHHKRIPVPPDRIGPAWGMKANSSQAQQTLAALRAYGLLQTVIMQEGRRVAITEQARTYLRAHQDTVKQGLVKGFALRPKQIRIFWGDWGTGRPADAARLDQLAGAGFSEDGADKFLRVYDDTMAFAGIGESDKIDAVEAGESSESEDETRDAREDAPIVSPSVSLESRAPAKVPTMEGERVVFTEEGQPNQYLKLIASGEVDAVLLEALEDFVKRQRKRLGLDGSGSPKATDRQHSAIAGPDEGHLSSAPGPLSKTTDWEQGSR
jgi:hypothetical protein